MREIQTDLTIESVDCVSMDEWRRERERERRNGGKRDENMSGGWTMMRV